MGFATCASRGEAEQVVVFRKLCGSPRGLLRSGLGKVPTSLYRETGKNFVLS
jgi:hypothetical protein